MIASPCCGSCEDFGEAFVNPCRSKDAHMMAHDAPISDDCYSPRNPIKSKHEEMWDELKFYFIESIEKKENLLLIDILEKMHKMKEKNADSG